MLLANDRDESVRERIVMNLLWPYNRGECSDAVKECLLRDDDGTLRQRLADVAREREAERSAAK